MSLIFETKNFIVEAPDKPLIDRNDGGHIKIIPKKRFVDRQQLEPKLAIELMRLTVIVGKAMSSVLKGNGVDIGRINYHDDGNWSVFKPEGPYLHYHLYGRAKNAKYQKYGHAVNHPLRENNPDFYKDYKPLEERDIEGIREEIMNLLKEEKFSDKNWGLK